MVGTKKDVVKVGGSGDLKKNCNVSFATDEVNINNTGEGCSIAEGKSPDLTQLDELAQTLTEL